MKKRMFFIIAAIALFWQVSSAQTAQERMLGEQTTGFSYQGSLKTSGAPASGNHDFEFRLWDAASGGAQVGATVSQNNVAVTNGVFAVTLDFGDQYPNASRFLEVRVRPTGGGAFTTLTPREQIKAVPYAVKSLNAEQLGGVAASQYVTTTTGSANYIQNGTTTQTASNFNISGNGTVGGTLSGNIIDASTQLNIGGQRYLRTAGGQFAGLFAGLNAGGPNPSGFNNVFFGQDVGPSTLGANNAFFGTYSGNSNTSGNWNSFFGHNAGQSNTSGEFNIAIGSLTKFNSATLENATVIGSYATVSQSNSLILGGILGENGCTPSQGCNSVNVGIGTTAPTQRLHVVGNGLFDGNGLFTGNVGIGTTTPGYKLHVVGENIRVEGNTTSISPRFSLNFTGGAIDAKKWQNYATTNRIRFTALNDAENSEVIWLDVERSGLSITGVNFPNGIVSINNLGAAGATALCRNASNQISTCSSSLRYKTNVSKFSQGISFINQLRPITYDWKDGGMRDVGFGAEDIAKIDPRFVTYNDKGEVEGVKYDRLSVAFVNAIKEQQAEISELRAVSSEQARKIDNQHSQLEDQQKQIERQRKELDALKKLVCAQNRTAEVCQP